MLTAGKDEEDLKCLALNFGATDLIDKPVSREDLLARIRSVLRLKSYQDQLREMNVGLETRIAERTAELKRSYTNFIWRLAKIGEYRDEQTGRHIIRVATYSRELARAMQLPDDFVETVYMTAPLHDIGKIGVPDSILLKRGELTSGEVKVMEQHCLIGYQILTAGIDQARQHADWPGEQSTPPQSTGNRSLDIAGSIALAHHERWDGQGYPRGLCGDEIPLEARIVALADVYDALTSARPYKQALSEQKTIEVLEGGPGSHFDPQVYAAFETLTEEFRAIRLRLSDGMCLASSSMRL
jgi:putative two-component system response regulator